ncbi:MAG TPA: response regulator [Xanthobacteraceae bacterium]
MSVSHAPSRDVFIVDDDPAACEVLAARFTQSGFRVTTYQDGASVMAAAAATPPACIILDLYMPGSTGLDILEQLDAWNYPAPIFVISGRADIPRAVEAIKRGACDFFEKQQGTDVIVARVRAAIDAWTHRKQDADAPDHVPHDFPGSAALTPREHEVLTQIVACASNKEAAKKLGISRRTVEIHRAHIMHKLGAKNSVDLIRIVLAKTPGTNLRQLSA